MEHTAQSTRDYAYVCQTTELTCVPLQLSLRARPTLCAARVNWATCRFIPPLVHSLGPLVHAYKQRGCVACACWPVCCAALPVCQCHYQPPMKPQTLRPAKSSSSSGSGSSRPSTSKHAAAPQILSPQQRQMQMMQAQQSASPSSSSSKRSSHSSASAAASPSSSSRPVTARPSTSRALRSPGSSSGVTSPASSTSAQLLEQRAAQSSRGGAAELPLQIKMTLQKRPEMWADPAFAKQYPAAVWDHYDVNKDGILNKSELLTLAKDLVDRIISMCRDGLKKQMPKSSDAEIEKVIKKELPHILPAKTLEESRKVMAEHIHRELDIDKDGVITRTEFMFQWSACAQKVLDVNKTKQEALSCVIL